jgi:hypothetical protein
LLAATAVYFARRTPAPEPAVETMVAGGESTLSTAAPAETAPGTVPPRAQAVEQETIDTAPATTLPRPTRAAAPPTSAPDSRPEPRAATTVIAPVAVPPTTLAAPVPTTVPESRAMGTLRLDVNAVQPSFGDMAESLTIEVRIDGRPLRSVSLRFDGSTPFARSRRRQAFDLPGVPAGTLALSVVVSADRGLAPVRAATSVEIVEGVRSATLDVRLRGNGEGDANFR